MTRKRIAIIGGGLAGLSAAMELMHRSKQLDVVLFEAKQATGGRVGSFNDPLSGEWVDYCQHVAMGCCTQFLNLMRSAGLENQFERYRELTFLSPGARPLTFRKPRWLPVPLHLTPFFIQLPHLNLTQKWRIARAMLKLLRSDDESLRSITATQWLSDHGQSEEMINRFWDVVVASALGETCQRVAMHSVRKVFADGFLAGPDASDLYVPKLPLRQLIAEQLTDYVRSLGVEVQTGRAIKALKRSHPNDSHADEVIRLLVEEQWQPFDCVVIATPAHAMARLLKSIEESKAMELAKQLEQVPYSPITGVHLWFDRPVMSLPHAVFLGSLTQWAFRNPGADEHEHYVQVVISASHDLRQRERAEVIEQIVAELRAFFPQAKQAICLRAKVVTDPQAVYSLSPAVDAIRPSTHSGCPGLYLAGDFVQTQWPATMEGAVISGQLAADAILSNRPPCALRL